MMGTAGPSDPALRATPPLPTPQEAIGPGFTTGLWCGQPLPPGSPQTQHAGHRPSVSLWFFFTINGTTVQPAVQAPNLGRIPPVSSFLQPQPAAYEHRSHRAQLCVPLPTRCPEESTVMPLKRVAPCCHRLSSRFLLRKGLATLLRRPPATPRPRAGSAKDGLRVKAGPQPTS